MSRCAGRGRRRVAHALLLWRRMQQIPLSNPSRSFGGGPAAPHLEWFLLTLALASCGAADRLETVHPQGPLMGYKTALDDWQKPEREDEGYSRPDRGVQPIGASGQNSSTRIMEVPMMWPTTKIVI